MRPGHIMPYLFRGDIYQAAASGSIGVPIDPSLTGEALAQMMLDHVQQNIGHGSSQLTSWTTSQKIATGKFAGNQANDVTKVNMADLQALSATGAIIIYEPSMVRDILQNCGNPKLVKKAHYITQRMKQNQEVLIRGVIPRSIQKRVK